MPSISSTSTSVAGVTITGYGMVGDVQSGAATQRGSAPLTTDLDSLLAARRDEFHVVAELAIAPRLTERRARGGASGACGADGPGTDEPRLELIGPPPASGDAVRQIVILEQDGFVSFILPDEAKSGAHDEPTNTFQIPMSAEPGPGGSRGVTHALGRIAVRVLAVVAKPALGVASAWAAREIEAGRRPYRLQQFGTQQLLGVEGEPAGTKLLQGGNALLLIHGTNSNSAETFRFGAKYLEGLHDRYGGRVLAFDHPSLTVLPAENAARLATMLDGAKLENVDVLAHSRGGLVARELLAAKPDGLVFRSVVFAATPNGGTPIADVGYLDQLLGLVTNAMKLIPDNPVTDGLGIALEILREWVLPAAEKSLPGVTAMHPDDQRLRQLAAIDPSEVRFRAVATNFEPRSTGGLPSRIRDLAMDTIFLGDANDLVVPTRSAYTAADKFRVLPEDRLVLDSSFGVAHNGFWREPTVLECLDQWLDPTKQPADVKPVRAELRDVGAEYEAGLRSLAVKVIRLANDALQPDALEAAAAAIGARPIAPTTSRGRRARSDDVVVVLPGLMGSRLSIEESSDNGTGRRREVWLQPWQLGHGRFSELAYEPDGASGVVVDGLLPPYGPLVARLSADWTVVPFAYDWRAPLSTSAERLRQTLADEHIDISTRTVHFVGHSTGGLIARYFVGSEAAVGRHSSGSMIQLGTPNEGSYSMPLTMMGEDPLVRAMTAGDETGREPDVVATFRSFPSFFEQFPASLDAAFWRDQLNQRFASGPIAPGLARATAFRTELRQFELDDRYVFIVGDGHRTATDVRREANGKLSVAVTTQGDGRVPHVLTYGSAHRPRVITSTADHGGLVVDELVLDDIAQLLATGTADREGQESRAASRRADDTFWVPLEELEATIGLVPPVSRRQAGPTRGSVHQQISDAAATYLGRTRTVTRSGSPPLRVRLVHGSLEQSKYPVAAGRYRGIPVEGALAFIDSRFKGALTDLHETGLFPLEAGTARYVPAPTATYPKGAILLGLGDFGSLTPQLLTRAVQTGALDYALTMRRERGGEPVLGISSVLAGTPGRYGLSLLDSIESTIRGVARAAVELAGKAVIDELEIVELYEEAANDASVELEKLAKSIELLNMEMAIDIDPDVVVKPGGRPGTAQQSDSGTAWPRVLVQLDEAGRNTDPKPRRRTLEYIALGRTAQVRNLDVQIDVTELEGHVSAAVQTSTPDEQTSNTLFELLFPNDAKLDIETFDNLHLLVDEETAFIPWEVLAGRSPSGEMNQPLALRAGMLRQLKPTEARNHRYSLPSLSSDVLVIGDPPTGREGYERLLGARQEALTVAARLADHYEVNSLVYSDVEVGSDAIAADIRNQFFAKHYRIIHIAAHGLNTDSPGSNGESGIAIGPNDLLGPMHFHQRLIAPDLVFLNCCHLGEIKMDAMDRARHHGGFAHLAASLSLELMRNGVKAVVAAGWAVDDRAAEHFAGTFYEQMLAGAAFGEATRLARQSAQAVNRSNTWGAYQCYGDPDFQLSVSAVRMPRPSNSVRSVSQLIGVLASLEKRAGDSFIPEHMDRISEELHRYENDYANAARYDRGDVWQALAQAYAEAGSFEDAVHAYRRAVDHPKDARASIDAVQQLANLEARLAARRHRDGIGHAPEETVIGKITDSNEQLFATALGRLEAVQQLAPSAELDALRGSLFKKKASTLPPGAKRSSMLKKSRDAYHRACAKSEPLPELNVYHACLTLLLDHCIHGTAEKGTYQKYWDRLVAQRTTYELIEDGDYYTRAKAADIRAVEIVTEGGLTEESRRAILISGFTTAFAVRSSARNRMSVVDNYRDLGVLLRDPRAREAALAVGAELEAFGHDAHR